MWRQRSEEWQEPSDTKFFKGQDNQPINTLSLVGDIFHLPSAWLWNSFTFKLALASYFLLTTYQNFNNFTDRNVAATKCD